MNGKPRDQVSLDVVRSRLSYDPETGMFTWKSGRLKGLQAGCLHRHGYRVIGIDRVQYLAHRLAFFLVYHRWPDPCVDHINGEPADNRICNLREATHGENHQSRALQSNNTSGYTGVCFRKSDHKWIAQIRLKNKLTFLGSFSTPEDAHEAYLKAKREIHAFNPTQRENHNAGSLLKGKGFQTKGTIQCASAI